jgi:hypothetical protein
MTIDKKSLKKMFPNLYNELETSEVKVPINAVRKNPEAIENAECQEDEFQPTVPLDKLRHFNPTAIDFIRRCDTDVQAEEIIAYLEKKGEINKEYATELRSKLKHEGIRCFGPKKEEYYYFKEGGIY